MALKIKEKITAALLAMLMMLSHVVLLPFPSVAASSAESAGYVALDGAHLNYTNTLTDRGDGTYELLIKANSTFALEEANTHSEFSEDGFYVAQKDGKYLVELWGGDGATISPDGTTLGSGGVGGKGGHVYGVIELEKGDVLYYSLGGDGTKTKENGVGGGANGTGGTHGGSGSTTVGGGGGYSALYLFDGTDFEIRYLDENGELLRDTLLESDRVSKYIMIAGGGGGAGAYSMDKKALPNGGAGGSIGHTSGLLLGSAYDVEGTFFVGKDGSSSGGNLNYVGKGGSNQPGKAIGTMLGWTDTETPNDWRGTYDPNLAGGAGGAGNLRGGSGGAGFCGGSGGLMESFILPNNVGGGGGGSSFISSLMTYQLSQAEESALRGENPSQTGGAICITYMEEEDVSYLNDLTFRFNTSEYFSVVSAVATNPAMGGEVRAVADEDEMTEYKFLGLRAGIGEMLEIRIVLAPMLHFAGGNNVPIFKYGTVFVQTPDENAHGEGEIKLDQACGYVNVPLNFPLHVQNHNTNDPGHSHHVRDLYVDNYADVRENLAAKDTLYHFIERIGNYQVTELDGDPLDPNGAVQPTETTKYLLKLTVTPKPIEETGVASVGAVVTEKVFVDVITVTVAGSNTAQLNGNWLSYSKAVFYDPATQRYRISLGFKSDTNRALTEIPQLPDFTYTPSEDGSAATQVQTTVIKYSGYYYIEIWGGNGGHGGQSAWFGSAGGAGGAGGYMGGYVYLKEGDILHVHIGANGEDGDNGTGFLAGGKGGKGGEPSAVALMKDENGEHVVDRYIMIAGGGSGGSGGFAGQNKDGKAPSATDTSIPSSVDTLEEMLAKYKGQDGDSGGLGIDTMQAGHNAYDSTIYNQNDPDGNNNLGDYDETQFGAGNHVNKGGGAFHLTYVQLDAVAPEGDRAHELTDYDVEFALSKYFAFEEYEVIDNHTGALIGGSNVVATENTYTLLHVLGIRPEATRIEHGNTSYETVDFTVNFYVKAKEEFLGGNDVMLVDVSEQTKALTNLSTGIKLVQAFENADGEEIIGSVDIMENSATDYVNVPINWDAIDENIIEVRDKVHLIGESDPVTLEQLYTVDEALRDAIIEEFNRRPEWCRDYVRLAASITDGNGSVAYDVGLAPDVTTTYLLSFGILPKTPSYYAKVAEAVTPVVLEKSVTIYAAYRVTFDTPTHIHHDSKEIKDYDPQYSGDTVYVVEKGTEYSVRFSIEEGDYSLPENIVVKRGDGALLTPRLDYAYSKETKKLTVYASSITGPLHIVLEETEVQYNLHYVVQLLEDGKPSAQNYYEYVVPMWAGDPINAQSDCENALRAAGVSDIELVGYTFAWDWGDGSETPLNTMPVEDWWVFGVFNPNTYQVTIRYVNEYGNALGEDYVASHLFGEQFTVTSPTFTGYVTNTTAYSATVDADFIRSAIDGAITLEVAYTSLSNEAVINLIREDGSVADVCKIVFNFGTGTYTVTSENGYSYTVSATFAGEHVAYRVSLPRVVGHHLASDVLEASLTAGGGNTHEVLYSANRYVLHFDPNGGECAETARTVIYGKPYHFDGVSYTAFPTAIKIGSSFLGWKDGNGAMIDENATITLDAENGAVISLTAVWETNQFTVTVLYVYEDGTRIAEFATTEEKILYGTAYTYEAPKKEGYTPAPAQYTGVMPAQNLELVFTYYEDEVLEVLSLTVSWGNLSFTASHGLWNPEEIRYEADSFVPNAANHTVGVKNDSETVNMNAVLSYAAASGFESIDGYFTEEDSASARKNAAMSVYAGEAVMRYVWLGGEIPQDALENTSIVCGTVTVTVTPQS